MATSLSASTGTRRILVIDDEPIIQQVLSLHLRSVGYEVVCAGCAADGIRIFSSGSFNLVITDYHLPDMNGLAVLAAVKSSMPDIPVVVISGFLDADLISDVINAGAVRYLKKPFMKTELLNIVTNILQAEEDA